MRLTQDNRYWINEEGPIATVGFTPDYLQSLGLVWVLVPRDKGSIKEGEPFASIESSKFLGPLRCPVSGNLLSWNPKVLENCEAITSLDHLIKVKLPKAKDEDALQSVR